MFHFANGVGPVGQKFAEQINLSATSIDNARQQFEDTIISDESAFTRAFVDAGETFKTRVADGVVGFNQTLAKGGIAFSDRLNIAGNDFHKTIHLTGLDFQRLSTPLITELTAVKTEITRLTKHIGLIANGVNERMQSTVNKFDKIHNELHQVSLNLRHLDRIENSLSTTKDSFKTSSSAIGVLIQKIDSVVAVLQNVAGAPPNSNQEVPNQEIPNQEINALQESIEKLALIIAELEIVIALHLKSETALLEEAS